MNPVNFRQLIDWPNVWVYLSGNPLFALFVTLLVYQFGVWCAERCGRHPLVNPTLIAVVLLATGLQLTGWSYTDYFAGAQFVHFLLGTATVALAIPIYHGLRSVQGRVLQRVLMLMAALLVGALVSMASAVGLARLLGLDPAIVHALWAKSITSPIAMGISDRIGASPTLTAVFAILTGVLGAALVTPVFNAMGLTRWWVRGFSSGVAAHGLGAARAFVVHPEAGRYASLGMGLHGVVGAVLVPWVYGWF
ncbi:MAG: LrgB family protein [Limnobacter sp.]|uniref:LrgB family protein n=1 Tax=Limnobacter sp. TaxID=2003368 RepID=UPI00391886F8